MTSKATETSEETEAKGPETETPPQAEAGAAPEHLFKVELEYDLATAQLAMRSAKCPTILLLSILRRAADEVVIPLAEGERPGKLFTTIDFDVVADRGLVASSASACLLRGILAMAEGMITKNQTMQSIKAMLDKPRILKP